MNAVLEIQHVTRSFGEKVVHRDVSFSLQRGEILALMGASGEGKSLILKMIIGLETPDSGSIVFESQNICRFSEDDLRRRVRSQIGYVFQNGGLFNSLTVEENLAYPLRNHTDWSEERIHRRINERLAALDLKDANDLYPDEISGGMLKRAGLARATMLDPQVVLLDEPTSGLDPIHVSAFARAVNQFKRERGLSGIFVTHDVQCAFAVSDRMAFLKEGVIHAIGPVDEMCSHPDPWVQSFLFPDFGESQ